MQVLTLTPFYPSAVDGAAGSFIAEPISALNRLGVKSRVIAVQPFYRSCGQSTSESHPASWVKYPCLPGGVGLSSTGPLLYTKLRTLVRNLHLLEPIDLIHAHAALPCGYAAALLGRDLGIPSVVTVHGLDAYFTRQVRGLPGKFCRGVAGFVYRSVTRVIGVSARVRDQVLNGAAGLVDTTVIYNGVDPERFYPAPVGFKDPVILSVGNLIPTKGHALLLRSFAEVLKTFPGAKCEIIGDGPERASLERLSNDLGIRQQVRFCGKQSRELVAEAMRRCTVFALPSRYEGLGCVYLEAMATGKPVIACRGQGIDEIVDDGKNGVLIDPEDWEELSKVLGHLLRDASVRRELGEAGLRTVLNRFTVDHQAAQLVDLYRRCAA